MTADAAWKDVGPGAARPPADAGAVLPPPSPEASAGAPDAPPADVKPGRPTTRAGRRAAAEAKKAAGAGAKDTKPKSTAKVPRRASLETRLAGSLTSLGTAVAVAGAVSSPAVQADGVAIIQHAPAIAAALDKVAKDDPRVAASLERMLTAGVWSGLVAALVPLGLTIAANHKAIPEHLAAMLGVTATEVPDAPAEPPAPGSVGVV